MPVLHRASTWVDATSSVEDFVHECGLEALKHILPATDVYVDNSRIRETLARIELGRKLEFNQGMAYILAKALIDPNTRSRLETMLADKYFSHLKPPEPAVKQS